MTSRLDIIDGSQAVGRKYGLIYTRKCGWVDLGHANPDGAMKLWDKIQNENGEGDSEQGFFRVTYKQTMGNKYIRTGMHNKYDIKKQINLNEKKSVALSIFLNVSHDFESMQCSWPFSLLTNSGYSAEDLVSNLIGFYRAINPKIPYLQICEPVSKDVAIKIWDTYGPVGDNKNNSATPFIYPTKSMHAGPMCGVLPDILNTIKPSTSDKLYKKVQ